MLHSFSKTLKNKNNNNNEINEIEDNKKKLDNHRIYKCKNVIKFIYTIQHYSNIVSKNIK